MIIAKSVSKKIVIGLMLTINIQSYAGITDYWHWLWESKPKVALGLACALGALAAFATWRF